MLASPSCTLDTLVDSGIGMQLSSVCRKLADAVKGMPSLRQGLDLCWVADYAWDWETFLPRFDSKLMLSWAPHVSFMALRSPALGLPSLRSFVMAASSMSFMHLHCENTYGAARAEILLAKSTSIMRMKVEGEIPSTFPACLRELYIDRISPQSDAEHADFFDVYTEAMLLRLKCLQNLTSLSINVGTDVCLSCASPQLPFLRRLSLTIYLEHDDERTAYDLSWLCLHRKCELHMLVYIQWPGEWFEETDRDFGVGLIHEIQRQQLRMHSLRICIDQRLCCKRSPWEFLNANLLIIERIDWDGGPDIEVTW